MKAIILAGGEGTRLRPLSLDKPKPMLRLFDRPLLEHLVILLRENGFTELCMTLHYRPESIRGYFGDGRDFGVCIDYRVETEAAGTAGSVRGCADFIGGDDFLVISGDAACDYDLRAMMEKHRLSAADATILVRPCAAPREYGLVLTDEDGCIRSFVEKPEAGRVCSELVNTGIYVFSPRILDEIPVSGSCDFGAELFPSLIRERRRLLTWQADGYWNDVGSCEAFLQTCRDVLDGKLTLHMLQGLPCAADGPCWLSPGAVIGRNVQLGPYTVIGADSQIGDGCSVSGSVIDGAVLEAGCRVDGSILSPGAFIGRESVLRDGCVLAEGAFVGGGSLLHENTQLSPGIRLPEGSDAAGAFSHSRRPYVPRFQPGGCIAGEAVSELSPERLLRMGRSSAARRTAAASAGGAYARLLSEAFLVGAGAAGRESFLLDATLPAAAASSAERCGMGLTLFVRQEGDRLRLFFFDASGLPLSGKQQRLLETSGTGELTAALPERCSSTTLLLGTEEAYTAAALCGGSPLDALPVACSGSRLLSRVFSALGAQTVPPGDGILQLRLSDCGFRLRAVDETGTERTWSELLCALAKAELRAGEQAVVLPYHAPALAEVIAEAEGGTVYRLERDGADAAALFRMQPWCRDGLHLAVRLISRLHEQRTTLADCMRSLPAYHVCETVVPVAGAEPPILRKLSRAAGAETVDGVRFREGECTATVRRLRPGELRILTESCRTEAAEEFCAALQRRIRELDK